MTFVKLRSEALAWRQVGNEVLLLDTKSAQYMSVNPTGSLLWLLIAQGCSVSELTDALARHFSLSTEQAAKDTLTFLSSLRELGLLEETAPQS